MPASITAVLFDLDGTLRHSRPNGYESFVTYLAELGHPITTAKLMDGHRWVHYYWGVSPELLADMHELGVDGHFQFTLSAGEAESYKPDPGIFLKAVALAGCAAACAAYVGDNYYA